MVYNAMIILFTQFFGNLSIVNLVAQVATLVVALFLVFLFVRIFCSKNITKWFYVAFIILAIALSVLYVLEINPYFLSGVKVL